MGQPKIAAPTVNDAEKLLDEAETLLRGALAGPAETLCRRALETASDSARAHRLYGWALGSQGKLDPAVDALTTAVTLDPDYVPALHDLAFVLETLGRHAAALEPIRQLVAKGAACPPQIHRLQVRILAALRLWQDALAAADGGLAQSPDDDELIALRGSVLRSLGRPSESLAAQEAALARLPDSIPARCEKGWALLALKQPELAIEVFDQLLELDDPPLSALSGMGVAEFHVGMHAAAIAAFDQTLARDANSFEGHYYRAVALQELRRITEARAGFEEVLRRWPACVDAHANLGSIERDSGHLEKAVDLQRHALAIEPNRPEIHSNLLLTFLYMQDLPLETLAREHAAWGNRFGSPVGRFTDWRNNCDTDRRLRIGIVSAELCSHPVSAWLIPVLEALDRQQFEVFCYASRRLRDAVTERIANLADGWRDVVALGDRAMADLVRADTIDILIDLTGHSAHNRLLVFGLKPAPVQASWLGYPYSTGLAAIDYAITDAVAVRPGEESGYAEQVVRLPGGRICYEPPTNAPPVAGPPVLHNGWITFGSFNNITKVTPDVVDAWCRILTALPTSRLILKAPALSDPAVAERLRAAICDRGFTSGRLELRGGSSQIELLAQYGDVDIALDPFPFCGGLTSCEALWMGVPLVTWSGTQPVSRQSEAFLRSIGRDEWVASSLDDYVRIALDLTRDPLRLADLRRMQRETMRASPLCEKARIARELGSALRQMWRAYVERTVNGCQ